MVVDHGLVLWHVVVPTSIADHSLQRHSQVRNSLVKQVGSQVQYTWQKQMKQPLTVSTKWLQDKINISSFLNSIQWHVKKKKLPQYVKMPRWFLGGNVVAVSRALAVMSSIKQCWPHSIVKLSWVPLLPPCLSADAVILSSLRQQTNLGPVHVHMHFIARTVKMLLLLSQRHKCQLQDHRKPCHRSLSGKGSSLQLEKFLARQGFGEVWDRLCGTASCCPVP